MSDTKLNDYAKLGVWPDGYYMAVNQFTVSHGFSGFTLTWAGQGVVAFERAFMLTGEQASMAYLDLFGVNPNFGGMLPADLDGPPPPAGAPNYFVEMDDAGAAFPTDRLQIFEFQVNWANPANSTFTGPTVLNTAAFDADLCGFNRNCIPQPGTAQRVDALPDRLMYRLQYRNFGTHQTLVTNHTVDVDGTDHAGIRWYELRKSGASPWAIHQQGTYAPDTDHRWMGSIALDRQGNLALSYSVSSATTFPSIRYVGRLAGDPLGTLLQAETTLIAGGGSQTHTLARWGDYSMMAVDPTDDCTFWYTQEYYAATSPGNWQTRIGSFKFPDCLAPTPAPTVTGTPLTATPTPTRRATWTLTPTRTPTLTPTLVGGVTITEFSVPSTNTWLGGISLGPDGALWFAANTANKIGRITASGNVTEFPLPAGMGAVGIVAGSDGALWFTGSNPYIGRITTAGSVTQFPLSYPGFDRWITAGADGALWFTQRSANRIGRITTSGVLTEFSVLTPDSGPYGITNGPDGALWFTEIDGSKIGRITTDGVMREFPLAFTGQNPAGIVAGPDGAIWFVEVGGNKIGRITTDGTITEFPIPSTSFLGKSWSWHIVSGRDGALWFAENGANKIGRVTTSGTFSEFPIPTDNGGPFGITAGPDGALWFTENTANRIGRITTGTFPTVVPSATRTPTVPPSPTLEACPAQSRIGVDAAPVGGGRLRVTLTARGAGNRLQLLQFAGPSAQVPSPNARIEDASGALHTLPATLTPPGSPTTYTFHVRRDTPGQATTVAFTVVDNCGAWPTLVGGGPNAF